MKKRVWPWVFASLLVTMLAAAGCSSSAPPAANNSTAESPANNGGSASDKEKVTLTYALWDQNQAPAMEEIAKRFTAANPHIEVKIEVTPWTQYWTKMDTAATGGVLPDLLWMNGPNIVKYASNDMLLPITDQIKQDGIDMSNYPEALINLYTVDGQIYGIPKDFDTVGLWYNKEMFDAAKVPYPDGTWDWAKVKEVAKQLTDPAKGVYGFAAMNANQSGYYNIIFQHGGFVISEDRKKSGYDDPKSIEALKLWYSFIEEKLSPPGHLMAEWDAAAKLFESGKVAMMTHGSWKAVEFGQNEYTKDKVDVTYLPKGSVSNASVIHGLTTVIAANTQHPEEAWAFSKFLGSKEAAEVQAQTGATIPAFKGTQDAWVKAFPNFQAQVFIDQAATANPYPVSKDTSKWNALETEYFTKVWGGEMKIEDAAREIATKMNEFLAQE
ncbi:MAG TPA: sugar ABC transporter substrate-binding protein [Candidatus Bathyarchaeia archaeon]|nr:sugar ABC transporter substrate-binding protein [Candidatus Bathyarchaeia archaeon]